MIGHSLGGQLATLSALHRQDRLAGLVLVAAGTAHHRAWPRADRWRARLAVHGVRAAAALLPWYPGAVLGFGGDQPRRLMRDWSYNALTGKYRCTGSTIDYEARLAELRLPVLAVTIREDPVAPPGAARELLAKLPQAERMQLEVAGAFRPSLAAAFQLGAAAGSRAGADRAVDRGMCAEHRQGRRGMSLRKLSL